MKKEEILANEHWEYLKRVLELHFTPDDEISRIEYHYKTAFIHGWKHAKEDKDDRD